MWSRISCFIRLGAKGSAAKEFDHWLKRVNQETGRQVFCMHIDREGEFLWSDFSELLKREGIKHKLSAPHPSKHKGLVERGNGVIRAIVRASLQQSGLPEKV